MADTVWASGFWASGFWHDGVWSSDTPDFWSDDFWAAGMWATGFWAPLVTPSTPTVEQQQGGRRIYDPDDHKPKYRRLSKRERQEIDRWFSDGKEPRYVAPSEQPVVTKRAADVPLRPLPVPGFAKPVKTDADRITAAKHFSALDAIEAVLDRYEAPARDLYRDALEHTERLRQEAEQFAALERQRLALAEQERQFAAEQARLAWEAQERARIAQEEEDEMISILLTLHEAEL